MNARTVRTMPPARLPEFEYVDRASQSVRYLEVGWPTWAARWHAHPEYELHLITETGGKAFVGDYIGEFQAGDLYLTGPNVPHNWITDELVYVERIEVRDMLVQFSRESIDALSAAFPEFKGMDPMWELARSGLWFRGFDPARAQDHFCRIRDWHGPARILAFLQFLIDINDHNDKQPLSVASLLRPPNSLRQARIAHVIDHVTHHSNEPITLEVAAEMAGMSRSAFSRNFQIITGNRFVEFVNQLRVGQACSMLQATDKPVSTICFEAGFASLASFNRQFLRLKKLAPSAYRRAARAGRLGKSSYTV